MLSYYRKLLLQAPTIVSRRLITRTILGIETSCDDTGVAIITEEGRLLSNAINSQTNIHVLAGGINPTVAKEFHRKNIKDVVTDALTEANLSLQDIDVIATTVKPGLASCLAVGLEFTKDVITQYKTPFIPIHHMQAHALMPRYEFDVPFPYLVLLMSGGHCLLAVAKKANEFLLLGGSIDDAPGEAFDKVARRLKLKDLPECQGLSGGASIERMAQGGSPAAFPLSHVMTHVTDCNFSFSGLKSQAMMTIEREEIKQGLPVGAGSIANVRDFCASFQYTVFHHVARRLQRALIFCELRDLLPTSSVNNLVVSGGVASNMFARKVMSAMCEMYNCKVVCPPSHLCTDNGLMIAWNAVELLRINEGIVDDPFSVNIMPKCPIGVDISSTIRECTIKLPRVKLLEKISN